MIHRLAFLLLLALLPLALAVWALLKVRLAFRLSYPWATHLPAAGLFVTVVGFAVALKLAGADGPIAYVNSVNQYPAFGRFLGAFVPLGLLAIGLSILVDELWARQEVRKSFNWLSLLDEAALGVLLLLAYGKTYDFSGGQFATVGPNWALLTIIAIMVSVALLLELFRRPSSREQYLAAEDTGAWEAELARRAASGERIAYVEGQNPASVTVLVVVLGLLLLTGAVLAWRTLPWVSLLLVVLAVLAALVYGGLRVSVTSTLLEVRLGMLGIRLLTLPTAEVGDVQAGSGAEGRPAEVRALALGGRRGVTIATTLGQHYLIGSDHPERLAAVLRAVTAAQ